MLVPFSLQKQKSRKQPTLGFPVPSPGSCSCRSMGLKCIARIGIDLKPSWSEIRFHLWGGFLLILWPSQFFGHCLSSWQCKRQQTTRCEPKNLYSVRCIIFKIGKIDVKPFWYNRAPIQQEVQTKSRIDQLRWFNPGPGEHLSEWVLVFRSGNPGIIILRHHA